MILAVLVFKIAKSMQIYVSDFFYSLTFVVIIPVTVYSYSFIFTAILCCVNTQ